MEWRLFADPVDVDDQVGRRDLVDVHYLAPLEDRQVDGLAGAQREFLKYRAGDPGEVELGNNRARQAHQAVAKTVLLGAGVLLDQTMLLERGQKAKDGRLVHLEPASQVRNPHFWLAAQELQDL